MDVAGCPATMPSKSGVVVKNAGVDICWSQSCHKELVADSTCEAETIVANLSLKEVIWISRLFKKLIGLSDVPILKIDIESAKKFSENPEFHFCTKHIQPKFIVHLSPDQEKDATGGAYRYQTSTGGHTDKVI